MRRRQTPPRSATGPVKAGLPYVQHEQCIEVCIALSILCRLEETAGVTGWLQAAIRMHDTLCEGGDRFFRVHHRPEDFGL